ncbi:MAG: FecR domain-containing protein [Rhodoferax sp.]|nr:FecR domain-containing protein [Rhodoferax sp.]
MSALTVHPGWRRRLDWLTIGALMGLCWVGTGAQAQAVGEVEFARGVGFAQTVGQAPRTLGAGLPLNEGDRLTTAQGASAIVKFNDGTRMTLRANSDLVIQQYQFKNNASNNSMVMQLLRGGLRAITGLIAKSSPNAARLQTSTATIGIRGTDFDARICTSDCQSESAKVPETPRPNAVQASAKLLAVLGDINAVDPRGQRRRLVDGGSVYPGETVETGVAARGILAFRDESRLTLGASTRFRVDSFVFDDKNPTDGRFLVSLLRGSMRALSGLIGKANHRNVGFTTPTATIGIRGTGLDLDCGGDDACSFFSWLGTIEVTPAGQTAVQVLSAGQGLLVGPSGMRSLTVSPLDNLPRPDDIKVDLRQLFGATAVSDDEPGLFVFVRDGHIEVTTARETLHLGRGETGFAAENGATARPLLTPLFLEFDRTPMPDSKNPMLQTVLGEAGVRTRNQCR